MSSESQSGRIFLSRTRNPAENLAIEESLMGWAADGESILFLYENNPAVVIGRFQNPWKECRIGLAGELNIPILRRISGGGTVVHGPGNLNFSFITPSRIPDTGGNLDSVIRALSSLGIRLFRNSRYDLRVTLPGEPGDFKVSGSAFRQTTSASMHHGTLLVGADLPVLKKLLSQKPRSLEVKGVASVPSPVVNLSRLRQGLTTADVIRALAAERGDEPQNLGTEDFSGLDVYQQALDRLQSREWIWEKTPTFRERFSGLPNCEEPVLTIEKGRVSALENGPEEMNVLIGCPYRSSAISMALGNVDEAWAKILAGRIDGEEPDSQ